MWTTLTIIMDYVIFHVRNVWNSESERDDNRWRWFRLGERSVICYHFSDVISLLWKICAVVQTAEVTDLTITLSFVCYSQFLSRINIIDLCFHQQKNPAGGQSILLVLIRPNNSKLTVEFEWRISSILFYDFYEQIWTVYYWSSIFKWMKWALTEWKINQIEDETINKF